ncbi:hypothetical protein DCO17_01725 [Polynucleobacter tropicus]|uniref:Uncharacterized protein n=1 Tax=Polynucleobacter tropicus TaxID=1743174 RepID=A0A6M9PXG7_9BURK|nr:oligosaccharide flippase family protein [Polynucleobacter tropicus]QKM64058.1 hypothetical protein DCO17_01725 [Polynucleobacter tropicus]
MKIIATLKRSMSIYVAGNLMVKGLSFIAIPIYANIFTPNDFGIIEMVIVSGLFMATLSNPGVDSAFSSLFLKIETYGNTRRSIIFSSVLQMQIIWGLLILLIALFISKPLSEYLGGEKYYWYYFALNFIGVFFTQIMLYVMDGMRLLHRALPCFLLLLAQSVTSIGLLLIFVVSMKMGILGVFLASTISSFILAIFSWALMRNYLMVRVPRKPIVIRVLKICLPLLPAGVLTYILMNGNRWILEYYFGAEAVGLFVLAAKFSLFVTIFLEAFRMAWWPLALRAMQSPGGKGHFYLLSNLYVGVACAAIVFITFLSPYLLKNFTAPAYYSAWPMVSIFCWQVFFYIFALIFSPGIWVTHKTYLSLPISIASVIAGVIFSCMLIPKFGAIGAAISNLLIFIVFCVITIFISEIYWRVNYPIRKFFLQIFVSLMQMLVMVNFYDSLPFWLLFLIAVLVGFGLVFSSIQLRELRKFIF